MDSPLEVKLCADFPELFRDRRVCECDNGWEPLIRGLCDVLMWPTVNARTTATSDWAKKIYTPDRLVELEAEAARLAAAIPRVLQVKEKFGMLRFYVTGANDEQFTAINTVESLSTRVCEMCGAMQHTRTWKMHWHKTLCFSHAVQRYGICAIRDYVLHKPLEQILP